MKPILEQIERAAATGTNRIELYTEPYASKYPVDPARAIAPYIRAAKKAVELGLGLNAGHDLSLENLRYFKQHIPGLAGGFHWSCPDIRCTVLWS